MPIQVKADLDLSRFDAAVKYVFEETRRTLPDIVNRAALVALIGGQGVQGAMQRTKKAARAAILAVPVETVARHVMSKHKGEKLTRAQVKQLVRREYRRRLAAIGYTANVGWNKAVIALGGHGIGKHATGKGYASFGTARPAEAGTWPMVAAEIVNAAPAASVIGEQPLQDALNDTARDMVEYLGGSIQEICNTQRA